MTKSIGSPHTIAAKLTFVLAAALSIFQLWQSLTGTIGATFSRPIHLTWVLVLVFLHRPLIQDKASRWYTRGRVTDLLMALLAIYAGWVIVSFDYRSIDYILYGLTTHDFIFSAVFLLLLMEATRRSVGWVMVAITVSFILYNAYGNLLPDLFAIRTLSPGLSVLLIAASHSSESSAFRFLAELDSSVHHLALQLEQSLFLCSSDPFSR